MGIVICIGMMAVGAILALAVDIDISGVNVHLVGALLLIVGVIGLCTYISILKRRRVQPPSPGAPVIEEYNKHHLE
ncbi:hypothetical protein FM076_17145 [Streptomyces albus subsp. chlorinus]|uniref:DUF6458 family protein n=1 Tax=Streptomyces albus TaxID=1888 RepID=UPI00156FE42E|nr:DUF6458 family protein [Streptomyces albus]NSC22800.1 hypothetical protein [Streptomyces albus subsp. chlorinus]